MGTARRKNCAGLLLALLGAAGCDADTSATKAPAIVDFESDVPPSDAPPIVDPDDAPVTAAPERCGRAYCGRELPSSAAMAAVGDADGDGHLDLLIGDAGRDARGLGTVTLLRGRGDGSFVERTAASGLAGYGAWAAHFADLDNDGDADLVMAGRPPAMRGEAGERGAVLVFDNDGRGRFTDRSAGRVPALDAPGVPLALDVADLDLDGRLDLVVGRAGVDRRADYAPSVLLAGADGRYRALAGLPADPGFAWVVLATDYDQDGRPDLLLPRDAFGAFAATERPTDAVPCDEDPGMGHTVAGWINGALRNTAAGFARAPMHPAFDTPLLSPMGVAAGDFDRDGRPDYYFTNAGSPLLLVARAGGGFDDRTAAAGLALDTAREEGGAEKAIPVGWSPLARDLDRDGRLDLLVTFGVIPVSRAGAANTVYLQGDGLRFTAERDTGFELPGAWSSLAAGDFDEDGDEDLVVGSQSVLLRGCDRVGAGRFLRNDRDLADRHWLRVRLVGTTSNRDALGATVTATLADGTVLYREVSRAGATMASSDPTVDLGLGAATAVASLVVRWPGGGTQRLADVPADRRIVVTEARQARD